MQKKLIVFLCLILCFLLSACHQGEETAHETTADNITGTILVPQFCSYPTSLSSEGLLPPEAPVKDLDLLYYKTGIYNDMFAVSGSGHTFAIPFAIPFHTERFTRHGVAVYDEETDTVQTSVFDYTFTAFESLHCSRNQKGQAAAYFIEYDETLNTNDTYLALFEDGSPVWKQNLTAMSIDVQLEEEAFISQILLSDDGYICIRIQEKLYFFDPTGNYVSTGLIPMANVIGAAIGIQRTVGGIYYMIFVGEDRTHMEYCTVDFTTQTIGTPKKLPSSSFMAADNVIYIDDRETMYYSDGRSLYRCDLTADAQAMAETPGEKLFDWITYDIIGAKIDTLSVQADGSITVVSHDPLTDAPEVIRLRQVPADTVQPKTEIVLAAGAYNDGSLRALQTAVSIYNRQSGDYRVTIASYDPDTESGFSLNQQIATDMMQGKQIDLILFHRDITMEYFDNLGILGDWYPYMDADAEYSRDAFLSCIMDAYETKDGTLPVLTTDFGLTTLIGATENLAGMERWTYSACSDYLKTLSWDQILLQLDKDKNDTESDGMRVFRSFLPMVLDDYIDEDAGSCSFDSESFRQLLTLCTEVMVNHEAAALKYASGAEEIIYEGMGFLREYNKGKTVLFNQQENEDYGANSILHPSDMMNVLINFFDSYGGEVTCIGYPLPDGTEEHGTAVTPWMQFGLTADAEHAEGAWEFIRGYLDYQERREQICRNVQALPCTRAALDSLYAAYLSFEYLAAGNPWLQEYSHGRSASEYNPLYHDGDPRACDLLDELLLKTTRRYSGNTAVLDILYEEASYFFGGVNALDDVVRRMQSRVGIYLSEHQ